LKQSRSHYLGQQTLSSVGVSVSDSFCSSPTTHFWSFSGCAAAKKVEKTYLKVYYGDMWSRSVTAKTENKYRICSRNLRTLFSILAAEKSGCVKYADLFCGGLDLGFILV
jgi:hypothetical protein